MKWGHNPPIQPLKSLNNVKTKHTLGWKPRRTIKFCSWDAEETGIHGSVEYVEVIMLYIYIYIFYLLTYLKEN